MGAAEPDARRRRNRFDRLRRNPEQHVAPERNVLDRARQDAERVERAGRLHHAMQAMLAVGRAIAEHAAERGRPDGRAGSLRAERDRHHAVRNRRRGAARRTAGRAREIARVSGLARMEVGEFGGDGLAEQNAARLARRGHAGGVALGRRPRWIGVPHSVGISKVSMMSLTPKGTPASGPRRPLRSNARAAAIA